MIIRGADGNDEQRIVEMENGLCRKYRLSRKLLYPVLQHADFHQTWKDPSATPRFRAWCWFTTLPMPR
jgi:hypothetical protein